ncbi:MAG: pyridoxamine 5'-phosphate oxidase family protein [Acidimicrobiaceae bacterium]|nr:pyridoxamine 5'-phosphate oxidase family protein [Acidimicrobiaceae bacterium]
MTDSTGAAVGAPPPNSPGSAPPGSSRPAPAPPSFEPTARTTLRRLADRGSYDVGLVHSILDEALICHVGFTVEDRPYVIPTIHARVGNTVYLHGSPASRMLRTLKGGVDVCVTVTIVDALVLARSAFHHSLNYRSVVVLGRAHPVADGEEKRSVLEALVDHIAPGRSGEVRPPSDLELRSTLVLALPLDEVSAKVRTGPSVDEDADLTLPVWAGLLPLSTAAGEAEDDPALHLAPGSPRPSEVVTGWRR